jgi:hypothetical protein
MVFTIGNSSLKDREFSKFYSGVGNGSEVAVNVNLMGKGYNYEIDNATNSFPVISYEHHEIHSGDHYYLSNYLITGSGIGSSLFFDVTTPNGSKWIHFVYDISSTLQTENKLWEGATLSGGTVLTVFNNNRNSTNTSSLNIRYRPTISGTAPTSGTLISASSWGTSTVTPSKQGVGGNTSREKEIILKSGTTYLIQVTSANADNLISYGLEWYEHTDKTRQF